MKEQLLAANESGRSSGAGVMGIFMTDRCYQRSPSCMPRGDVQFFGHGQFLHDEEILPTYKRCRHQSQAVDAYLPSRRLFSGSARLYRRPGTSRGNIGFIGAVCPHFYYSGYGSRLKPQAKWRPRLLRDEKNDIRKLVPSGFDQRATIDQIQTAITA